MPHLLGYVVAGLLPRAWVTLEVSKAPLHHGKDITMNRILLRTLSDARQSRAARCKALLTGCVLLTALCTPAAAQQQPPEEASIFRLVTFQVMGDYRLGATQGNGESDIVDIHNAVRALKAAGAPQVRDLGYIPADMKTLIEVGDEAVEALKTVYRTALDLRASGRLVDTGGDRRVFYPDTAVRLRTPIPNPNQVFGMANNYIEEGAERNAVPSYFLKSAASIAGRSGAFRSLLSHPPGPRRRPSGFCSCWVCLSLGPKARKIEDSMATKAKVAKWLRSPKYRVQYHNRCHRCTRPRAYIRYFGICRICFRQLALLGELPGVRKASL